MSRVTTAASAVSAPKERFFYYFQLEATALQEQMGRLEGLSTVGGERIDAIDHCLAGIARLQKEVQDASSYTTAYDQRIYSEGIKALHEKLEQTRRTLAPKSKFTFKSSIKKNKSAISLSDAAELALERKPRLDGHQQDSSPSAESSIVATPANQTTPPNEQARSLEPPRKGSLGSFLKAAGVYSGEPHSSKTPTSAIRKLSFTSSNSINISTHSSTHIIVPSSAASATSSGSITNMRHCIVDMFDRATTGQHFAGLTIKHVRNSLLICGSVGGAAHITSVENSVIVVTTRQFRMHQCRNCIVYLNVSSKPIIEDCSGIRFAPLPKEYLRHDEDTPENNQWDQVQDFKWLKAEHSPNWSLLASEDVTPDETWRDIVPGGPGWSLDDILKAVGVPDGGQ